MDRFFSLIVAALLFIPITVFAQNADEKLAQGVNAYEELELDTAITLLNEALQLDLPQPSQMQAHMYLGFCYVETDQAAEAKEAFENLLHLDSAYELSSELPRKYLNVFLEVKAESERRGEGLLQDGINAYGELELAPAIDYLEQALTEKLSDDLKIKAYQYLAFCYIEEEYSDKAKHAFQTVLDIEGNYQLSDEFPPKYHRVFNQLRPEIKPEMEPIKRTVYVRSTPPDASVYFDGQLQSGKTPMQIENVDDKGHTLRLSLDGHEDRIVEVAEGGSEKSVDSKPLEFKLTLVQIQVVTEKKGGGRGILYAIGGGIVAVGGVVGALLFNNSGGTGNGNDDDDDAQWPKSDMPKPPGSSNSALQ